MNRKHPKQKSTVSRKTTNRSANERERKFPKVTDRLNSAQGQQENFVDNKNLPKLPSAKLMEVKIYGFHACAAIARNRMDDIIRVYLTDSRMKTFSALLSWCAKHKRAYHIISPEEMQQVTGSIHHEGIALLIKERAPMSFESLHNELKRERKPTCVIYLGGVSNPHNLGAIVRVAAHFGISTILIDESSKLTLSGAVYRVAQGGMEAVRIVRLPEPLANLKAFKQIGFSLIGTTPRQARSVYKEKLGERIVYLIGAEADGLSRAALDLADRSVTIPGSGSVESLNVSSASAILLSEFWRSVER